MNLHEYQAKALLADYGVPVPEHRVIDALEQAEDALTQLESNQWVIKAQVHAGGRGKAGGVRLVEDKAEALAAITELLGSRLVTDQTTSRGQPVNQVLVERPARVARELYVGAVVDRSLQRIVIMVSTEGGVEIEKVAQESPEKILRTTINPLVGLQPYQCRQLGFGLGLTSDQIKQFTGILAGLARLFKDKDLSLLEINPLAVTKNGRLVCLDAKVNIDDNALFRHPNLNSLRDVTQEDGREVLAKEWGLNYISLNGDIGCMVNGAGLAMATMDLIKLHGSNPANFLDVGGSTSKERVVEALKIILSDEKVKGVLVNIFGGIVRCDMIAEGIVSAVKEVSISVPVVVRLEGNNAERGRKILTQSRMKIVAAEGLQQAAERIIAAVKART